MIFKFFIVLASLAFASCAHVDMTEHMANQMQQQLDMKSFQNDQIREHHDLNQQQRQMHVEQMMEHKRMQEQFMRDQEQGRFDRARENHRYQIHVFGGNNQHYQASPAVVHLTPAIVHVPASTRHVNVHDDSNYNFRYAVSDLTTGDIKSHQETRRGDEVQGQYTMMDSDGYHRTVNYRANDRDGFDAEVRREPAVTVLSFAHNQPMNNLHKVSNYHGHYNQDNINKQFVNRDQWKRH